MSKVIKTTRTSTTIFNVLADEIAGDMMKSQIPLGLPRLNWLPCDPCPIYIVNREGDQVRICSHLLDTLRDEVTKKKTMGHTNINTIQGKRNL